MTAMELYEALRKAGIDFDLIEIFEGERWLSFKVDDDKIEEGKGQ